MTREGDDVSQSSRVVLTALSAAAVLTMSGCAAFDDAPDDVVYCVDANNQIVDDAKCDDTTTHGGGGTSPLFWYMIGRYQSGLSQGTALDPSYATSRVPYNDPTARSNAGLSKSGKVAQVGKSVSGKSGGFGSGSSGGSGGKSGGFGSSGSSGG